MTDDSPDCRRCITEAPDATFGACTEYCLLHIAAGVRNGEIPNPWPGQQPPTDWPEPATMSGADWRAWLAWNFTNVQDTW